VLLKIKEDLKDVDEFGEVEKEILNVMDVECKNLGCKHLGFTWV
jgi:hypothetical protein